MSFIDRIDSVARRIERFLSGNAVSGPLYITNRTLGQKIRVGVFIGAPVLALGVLMVLALNNSFDPARRSGPRNEPARKEPTGEITAKVLPSVEKDFTTDYSRDVDVLEAAVSRNNDHTLYGKVRNNTDHPVRVADLVFDVTDEDGSQLGGVAVRVENIPAKSTAAFKVVLEQQKARSALVREVHSR